MEPRDWLRHTDEHHLRISDLVDTRPGEILTCVGLGINALYGGPRPVSAAVRRTAEDAFVGGSAVNLERLEGENALNFSATIVRRGFVLKVWPEFKPEIDVVMRMRNRPMIPVGWGYPEGGCGNKSYGMRLMELPGHRKVGWEGPLIPLCVVPFLPDIVI